MIYTTGKELMEMIDNAGIEITEDFLEEIVNEINSYNNDLEYLNMYLMEDLDELLSSYNAWEITRMVFYGDFNPNDEYFKFDGYANLESFSEYDYLWRLRENKETILLSLIDNWTEVDGVEIVGNENPQLLEIFRKFI